MISDVELNGKVAELLSVLYQRRFARLKELTLRDLLNKNPYLYRAVGIQRPDHFLDGLLNARISSSDETIFGNEFFEPLALWAAGAAQIPGRQVSVGAGAGQDISIELATEYFAIAVKSGKNIFNSQSDKGQKAEFEQLEARLKKLKKAFHKVVGFGYGRHASPKGDQSILKKAGQDFWELLTAEPDFYIRISNAISSPAAIHKAAFDETLLKKHSELLRQFMIDFVESDGTIRWNGVVEFNSARVRPKRQTQKPSFVARLSDT
jgi:Type II restriction endonuclease EcoO109I